jgi:hypothetical protein
VSYCGKYSHLVELVHCRPVSFLSLLSILVYICTMGALYISSEGKGDRNERYVVFGQNLCKFYPNFKIFRAHKFFPLKMKVELMHLTCLVKEIMRHYIIFSMH